MYYLILLVFFLSFVAFIYFSFQVHFCSIFPHLFTFLAFFFFCTSNESIICFICMLLFSVLSLLAFCKSSEKTVKTIQTIGKTQIPFTLLLCYFGLQLVNLLYFYPPSHSNLCTGNHPTPKPTTFPGPSPTHLPRGLWERRCQKLPDVLRYTYF